MRFFSQKTQWSKYLRSREAQAFKKESWFYGNIAPSYAPKLLGAGEDYLVLKRIKGEGLVSRMEAYDGCEEGEYGPLHCGNQQGTEPDCAPGRDALV